LAAPPQGHERIVSERAMQRALGADARIVTNGLERRWFTFAMPR
jgi:hypothetical protein